MVSSDTWSAAAFRLFGEFTSGFRIRAKRRQRKDRCVLCVTIPRMAHPSPPSVAAAPPAPRTFTPYVAAEQSVAEFTAKAVILGVLFTACQAFEYSHASFGFKDGIYASTFYMATGFHGFHVIVGTIFLLVCLLRAMKGHFKSDHHFGFEAAAWYWHFVDVVWLFLFTAIYWWGSGTPAAH